MLSAARLDPRLESGRNLTNRISHTGVALDRRAPDTPSTLILTRSPVTRTRHSDWDRPSCLRCVRGTSACVAPPRRTLLPVPGYGNSLTAPDSPPGGKEDGHDDGPAFRARLRQVAQGLQRLRPRAPRNGREGPRGLPQYREAQRGHRDPRLREPLQGALVRQVAAPARGDEGRRGTRRADDLVREARLIRG